MPRKEENPIVIGETFGRLVVREAAEKKKYFVCDCQCGKSPIVRKDHLRSGRQVSCGCFKNESASLRAVVMHKANTKHGASRTKLHGIWFGIKQRCYNEKNEAFKYYGAKGVILCERWHDFSNFLSDLGQPEPGMTLDRICSKGNYEASNCRWATRREQMYNTSRNHFLSYEGKTQTIQEWAEEFGMKRTTFEGRIENGWSMKEALEKPIARRKKKHL